MESSADTAANFPPDPREINDFVAKAFPGSRSRCSGLGHDWAMATISASADDLRPGGYIAGPVQFALADAALWYLVFAAIGRIEPMALTSELSIRYLRPAIGTQLHARADLASAGRRNVVGSVTVWADDNHERPSAIAQGTYALPHTTAIARSSP